MPHLVIQYTADLDRQVDMPGLCRTLADTLLSVRDDEGRPVFPVSGTRVLACPAAHSVVADGSAEAAFAYFNLRMARGRSAAMQQRAGQALAGAVQEFFAVLLARRAVGLTVQVDEGHEVFDAKVGNLHAAFAARP